MASCEVVGYCVLVVGDVGHPIEGVDVVDAEYVEGIDSEPHVLDAEPSACVSEQSVVFFSLIESVGHADVHASVTGHSEYLLFASGVGRSEGESAGVVSPDCYLPSVGVGEVVAEEY